MNSEEINKAVQRFLNNGGKIQKLPSEVDRSSSRRVGFSTSNSTFGNAYSYDSTIYATEKQTNKKEDQ